MNNEKPNDLGVLNFMPAETFHNPNRGLAERVRPDLLLDIFRDIDSNTPPQIQSVSTWPRIHTAIRRGELFVLETSTPDFTATLRFVPNRPTAGEYHIQRKPRGRTEKGRTEKVIPVSADEKDWRVTMLSLFSTRFVIATFGDERPHARMVWLIGLRAFRVVDENEID